MKENSFLKKFKGRMEQIGKNGYREILNNVHINIVDYIKNSQKVKKTKKKVDKYGQMKSEINKEITRNLNNNSRTKNTTLSPKKNKSEEFVRFNDNNNIKNEGYIQMKKTANILVNYPYMVGDTEYFQYIKENFFNELENKGVCSCNNFIYNRKYYSYICDSKSEYFMNSLKNNYSDLIFEFKELLLTLIFL